MKIISASLLVLVATTFTFAQAPNQFNYQAVVRNAAGDLVVEQEIDLKITILSESVNGESEYVETHNLVTSAVGTIVLRVGSGQVLSGLFAGIDWGANLYFMETSIDLSGNGNFEIISTSQLLSVPYALYAERSGDNPWNSSNGDISYETGRVGIGNTIPQFELDVLGTVNAAEYLIGGAPLVMGSWGENEGNISFNSGNVGIGTTSPTTGLEVVGSGSGNIRPFVLRNDYTTEMNLYGSGDLSFLNSSVILNRSRGTFDVPSDLTAGDRIGGLFVRPFLNGAYQATAAIHMYVEDGASVSSFPTDMRFETTGNGSIIREERMRITGDGNIGIGNNTPGYLLDVSGTVNANEYLVNGSPMSIAGPWDDVTGGISYNSGNVGINTSTPSSDLDIVGDGTDDDIISIRNNDYARYAAYGASDTDLFAIPVFVGFKSRGTVDAPTDVNAQDRITGIYGGMYVNGQYRISSAVEMFVGDTPGTGSYPSYIKFGTTADSGTSRQERVRIDEEGNVGIGTASPAARLQVKSGDVYLEDVGTGIITKSPDGNCWRMTVDNSGNIVTTAITCPN